MKTFSILQFAIANYWQEYQVPSMMASFVYTNPDVAVHVRRRWNELSFRKDHRRRSWKSSSCWRSKKWCSLISDQVCGGVAGGAGGGGQLELFDQPGDLDGRWTHRFMFSSLKLITTKLVTSVNSPHFNGLKPNRPLCIINSFKPDSPRCSNCPNWRTNNGEPLISPMSQICQRLI